MNTLKIELKNLYNVKGGTLSAIYMDTPWDDLKIPFSRPALVVVPGGGYGMVSRREAEPVATYFLHKGFQVFVLDYLCAPDGVSYPEQLYELASAMDYVKKNADKFYVNPDKIFCIGFSAGGHLVGNLSVEYEMANAVLNVDCKPAAVGLCYPVISSKEFTHGGSFKNLLQGYEGDEYAVLREKLSLETRVTPLTPPAFIWTTAADDCVPCKNSLVYATALAENNVKFELHVYPDGHHGLSTCQEEINAPASFLKKNSEWLSDCEEFFKSI